MRYNVPIEVTCDLGCYYVFAKFSFKIEYHYNSNACLDLIFRVLTITLREWITEQRKRYHAEFCGKIITANTSRFSPPLLQKFDTEIERNLINRIAMLPDDIKSQHVFLFKYHIHYCFNFKL